MAVSRFEPPRVRSRLPVGLGDQTGQVRLVQGFELDRRPSPAGPVKPTIVVPVHPSGSSNLDFSLLCHGPLWGAPKIPDSGSDMILVWNGDRYGSAETHLFMVIETSRPVAVVARELGLVEGALGNW